MNNTAYDRECREGLHAKHEYLAMIRQRQRRKEERRPYLIIIAIGFLLGILSGALTGCAAIDPIPKETASAYEQSVTTESPAETRAEIPQEYDDTEIAGTADAEASTPKIEEPRDRHVASTSTWHPSTRQHNPSTDLIIRYNDDNFLFNFNDSIAVGYGRDLGYWRDFELDFGFILSVADNDSVKIQIYNYTDEPAPVLYVYAERSTGDYKTYEPATEYIIDGYADCKDGVGEIVVRFEEGGFASAAVFKQGDQLYVANHTLSETYPAKRLEFRDQLEEIFENQGIIEEDTLYTENIYYPIVPIKAGETTDTAYWLAKADELVEDDWSDMRKVLTFYNYCRENIAYDNYVVSQNDKARWHLYGNYSGDQFASKTGVGICEDVANIIAIMCRAQDIPAMVVASSSHAWDYVYIEDYDRWISVDATPDLLWRAMNEDPAVLTSSPSKAYTSIEKNHMTPIEVYIGNPKDMERQNMLYPWEQREGGTR